jgi:hypothetical protein
MTPSSSIDPRAPAPLPGGAPVDPAGREGARGRGPRDRRRPARREAPPEPEEDPETPAPPAPGRLDILA